MRAVEAQEDGWTRPPNYYGSLAKLPPELRYEIFHYVLRDIWDFKDPERLEERPPRNETSANVLAVLAKCLGLLSANKTLRRECMLLVCQRTMFRLNDMDHAVHLLRAIGSLGRENIRRLHLPWASGSDSDELWRRFPEREDNFLKLPSKHASMCVDLLRECTGLTHLRVQISEDVLSFMSKASFQTDEGILGLSSLRIAKVEIYDMDDRISTHDYAVWLKNVVEGGASRADLPV